jgi:hypothetical protein
MKVRQTSPFPPHPAGIKQDCLGRFYIVAPNGAHSYVEAPVQMRLTNHFQKLPLQIDSETGRIAHDNGTYYQGGFSSKFSHDTTHLEVLRGEKWVRV